jgi:hypothetical protein
MTPSGLEQKWRRGKDGQEERQVNGAIDGQPTKRIDQHNLK